MMIKSPDPKVPLYWGMFSKVEPKLQAGVLIGLGVACADFSTPNMIPPDGEIQTGCRDHQQRATCAPDLSEIRPARESSAFFARNQIGESVQGIRNSHPDRFDV